MASEIFSDKSEDVIKALLEAYLVQHAGNSALVEQLYKFAEVCKNKCPSRGVVFEKLLRIVTKNQSTFKNVSNQEALALWRDINTKVIQSLSKYGDLSENATSLPIPKTIPPVRGKPDIFSEIGKVWKAHSLGIATSSGTAPKILLRRENSSNSLVIPSIIKPLKRLKKPAVQPSSSESAYAHKMVSNLQEPVPNAEQAPFCLESSKTEVENISNSTTGNLSNGFVDQQRSNDDSTGIHSVNVSSFERKEAEKDLAKFQFPEGLSVKPIVGDNLARLASSGNDALFRSVCQTISSVTKACSGIGLENPSASSSSNGIESNVQAATAESTFVPTGQINSRLQNAKVHGAQVMASEGMQDDVEASILDPLPDIDLMTDTGGEALVQGFNNSSGGISVNDSPVESNFDFLDMLVDYVELEGFDI